MKGHATTKKTICNCPNGLRVNSKGDIIISLEPTNHAIECRIRKNIRTTDVIIDSNYSDYQVTNTSYRVLGEYR